ncbi:hypothetical protein, partial [Pseudonocardia sp. EV170527-09]|uniref:hypothetical protein n=1 Tax=Pseudonocardia sp. EV170527-09 TaxID=2603411 RepID=UPI001960727A
VYMTFNIKPPNDIRNLFDNWLHGVSKKEKVQKRVGVCALLWALWNVRNDYILTEQRKLHLCRLSRWLLIGSVRGPT